MNELSGAGIVVKGDPQVVKLKHNSTSFQAKVMAVEKPAAFLLDNKIESMKILINFESNPSD